MTTRIGEGSVVVASPARTLRLIVAATYLVSMSNNTLGVAVPVIVRHFHAGAFEATLVVLMPSLASTSLMLGLGRAGDLFGRRVCYLAGLVIFALASLLLGFAPDVWVIVALQVLQAVGVASVWANSVAILRDELDPASFRRGLGLYIAAIAVAEMMGPSVGGIVAETIGWRWIFWLNAPIGSLCALLAVAWLPVRPPVRSTGRMTATGPVLCAAGLAGLVLSISLVESSGRASALVIGGIAVSLLVLVAFVARERRVDTALLDVQLFRNRTFSLTMLSGFLNAMAEWGPVLIMVLFFQAVRGDTPLRAGLIVIPLPVFTGLCSAAAGRLGRRASAETLSVVGSLVATAGLAMLVWALSAPYVLTAVALGIVGVGSGIFGPANANALVGRAPPHSAGSVNGTRLTVQQVGWVMSTAIVLTVAVSQLPVRLRHEFFAGAVSRISQTAVRQLLVGYRFAVGLLALFALLGALTAVAARAADSVPAAS